MTDLELREKLAAIFNVDPTLLPDAAKPSDIPGWDSMAALGIISLLDDAGAHDITTDDAAAFQSIGDIHSYARARKLVQD